MTEHGSPTYLRGRVVTATAVIDDGVVVVEGDTIAWVGPADAAGPEGWPEAPDAPAVRLTLMPGLVDLHNHGGGGAGFPDVRTPDEARVAVLEHLAHGTTTLVASLVTAKPDTLRQRVGVLTVLADAGELAGIHLEGPFLAAAMCGAQDPDLIQAPDADLVAELAIAAHGHLVTMTLAPELVGVLGDGGVMDSLISAGRAAIVRTHRRELDPDQDCGRGRARPARRDTRSPVAASDGHPPVQPHAPAHAPGPGPDPGAPGRGRAGGRRRRAHRGRHARSP